MTAPLYLEETIEDFQICYGFQMRTIIRTLSAFIRAIFIYKQALTLENLALRQQLVINLRKEKRASRLKPQDRIFWAYLSHIWDGWKSSLVLVKPDTVIGWHRQGFRLYKRWQSRKKKAGRTRIPRMHIEYIKRICRENQGWGEDKIYEESSTAPRGGGMMKVPRRGS